MSLSNPARKALKAATLRPRGNVCPIVGVHAAAQTMLLGALQRRGLIEYDGPVPRITDAGRAILDSNT